MGCFQLMVVLQFSFSKAIKSITIDPKKGKFTIVGNDKSFEQEGYFCPIINCSKAKRTTRKTQIHNCGK